MLAIGVWSGCERTFGDVMVTHPTGDTNMKNPLDRVYRDCDRKKKAEYNQRIFDEERGTFTPLTYTTTGGMSQECSQKAELVAVKRKEHYSKVMRHIQTSLRFALLRAMLVAAHGVRGKDSSQGCDELEDISYNMVPHQVAYES